LDAGFIGKLAYPALPEEMGTVRHLWLAANFPQMNFTQMHERLRQELLRRIQRGTLSVSLLARQSGLGQPHLSNFLRNKRQLSLQALDRVLASQRLSAADLLPALARPEPLGIDPEFAAIPVVSHASAIADPFIRSVAGQEMLRVPARMLESLQARAPGNRRAWQRFVAVRVEEADALPMDPLVLPGAIALLDRHYNSLAPFRPERRNLYAVRQGARLTLRYAEILSRRLVLRPHSLAFPVELIDIESGASAHEFLAGRVALILNEI
jgi:transcriptional regulator with XRE-family HTH domain